MECNSITILSSPQVVQAMTSLCAPSLTANAFTPSVVLVRLDTTTATQKTQKLYFVKMSKILGFSSPEATKCFITSP